MQHRRCLRWFAGLLPVIAALGCQGGTQFTPPSDSSMLRGITRVYAIATRDLGRPPKSMDELKAVYAQADPDPSKYVRSARDGEEFVVAWGLNLQRLPADTVLAYERKGVDGKRMVVTLNGEVREVSEDQFAKLKFPKGHKPGG